MIGSTISHYKITEKLGGGGMGVVYKAQDLKLNRTVALKFLPPSFSYDEEAKNRFIHEAQAASSFDHPNICTIHEIGKTEDDQLFIAMACYEGETLKKKLENGQIKIDEAIDIISQVAEGLNRAHQKGIIHRDIKPANIFIKNDGTVKILDFGLAKVSTQTQMTTMGTTVGTVAYMSPEQTRGDEVNHRTDIWSLGVVMYEMLTGELPFIAEYDQAVIYSILNDKPKPIESLREDLPEYLEQIVIKSLEKDSAKRYHSLYEILMDLQKPASLETISEKKEKSIIVLPFDDMSPDKDNEYFSDGLTEEIITDLSHVQDLLVISRNSAMTFKGTSKKTKELAREVNVQYVLEGSVRKAGNDLRITAQLIDATTEAHIWAEKYKGTLDDVFDIQEKVSRSIVDALKIRLTQKESKQIAERPIDNIHAYDCYLKARQEMWKWTEEGLDKAKKLIDSGLQILGDNEYFHVAKGLIYTQHINFVISKDKSLIEKAEKCALKALELNHESSRAHFLMGFIDLWRPNIKEAVKKLKKSLELDPKNSETLNMLAYEYAISGKSQEAAPLFDEALKLDPLNPLIYGFMSAANMYEGKFETAMELNRKFNQLDPENPLLRVCYSYLLAYTNQIDDALINIDQLFRDLTQSPWSQLGVFLKHALQSNKTEALRSVTVELKAVMKDNNLYPLLMADCYSLIGEKNEAINCVENATQWGFINYHYLNKHALFLENIRGEERFKKLMERVKYEWENFEV